MTCATLEQGHSVEYVSNVWLELGCIPLSNQLFASQDLNLTHDFALRCGRREMVLLPIHKRNLQKQYGG